MISKSFPRQFRNIFRTSRDNFSEAPLKLRLLQLASRLLDLSLHGLAFGLALTVRVFNEKILVGP